MTQKVFAAWQKRIAGTPPTVIIAIAVILCLLVIGIVIQTVRAMQTPDINSPNVFSQVPTEKPLGLVTASQVVDYLKGHKVGLADVKPYSSTRLKPAEALTLSVQGQAAVILSYTDTNTLLADRGLFTSDTPNMPAVRSNGAGTVAAPTAKPTAALAARWNMDDVGNVILLTDKTMSPALRADLLSHLYSLIVAPARPAYPTPTP